MSRRGAWPLQQLSCCCCCCCAATVLQSLLLLLLLLLMLLRRRSRCEAILHQSERATRVVPCQEGHIIARAFVFEAAEEMPAYMWWDSYAAMVPRCRSCRRWLAWCWLSRALLPSMSASTPSLSSSRTAAATGCATRRQTSYVPCIFPQFAPEETHERTGLFGAGSRMDSGRGSLGHHQIWSDQLHVVSTAA